MTAPVLTFQNLKTCTKAPFPQRVRVQKACGFRTKICMGSKPRRIKWHVMFPRCTKLLADSVRIFVRFLRLRIGHRLAQLNESNPCPDTQQKQKSADVADFSVLTAPKVPFTLLSEVLSAVPSYLMGRISTACSVILPFKAIDTMTEPHGPHYKSIGAVGVRHVMDPALYHFYFFCF